ncbi:MAG: hypothetical protein ACI8QG_001319, partial [Flavobacteriales bacterium]
FDANGLTNFTSWQYVGRINAIPHLHNKHTYNIIGFKAAAITCNLIITSSVI